MKRYKSKIMKTINFIRLEGKFERGDLVKFKGFKKDAKQEKYNKFYEKYLGEVGIVADIDYSKKGYNVAVKFKGKETIDTDVKELEKIDDTDVENINLYGNLWSLL